jgi:hypothetical protein
LETTSDNVSELINIFKYYFYFVHFSQIFSESLDPVMRILLTPADIAKIQEIKHDAKSDPDGMRFQCKLCPDFKAPNKRDQLHHLSTLHLKKLATVEAFGAGMKFLWTTKRPYGLSGKKRMYFECGVEDCDGEDDHFVKFDKKGSKARRHICKHFKDKKALYLDVLEKTFKKYKKQLGKVQIKKLIKLAN